MIFLKALTHSKVYSALDAGFYHNERQSWILLHWKDILVHTVPVILDGTVKKRHLFKKSVIFWNKNMV